ncbi:class-II fumarase/aspartase family protein [Streptomyces iconiensis]|uniref:Adenylosuccinate lyase family protein n=1 Tax=Streptomyces iconiensis TaxID=1384038 RepID=A0ABT6ZPU9_9ACTN|nr:adenylosuccinate lyase family protein [Streptomyces iconiensis]MDJ1130543.1 adenylosuccinate lyase family protein [Streptomyces iconiensis]
MSEEQDHLEDQDHLIDAGLLSPVRAGAPVEAVVSDAAWLRAMIEAEVALVRAQARLGTVPQWAARTIAEVSREDRVDLRTVARAARENANPVVALVREFTRAVAARDPRAAGYVHRGSTSQDIFDTGAMLVARRAVSMMSTDLRSAAGSLGALARRHHHTPMAGRTLALQAVPITFGLKVAGWRRLVLDADQRMGRLLAGGLPVSLGGAAGTLAGYLAYATVDAAPGADGGREDYADRLERAFALETGLARQTLPWHALRTPIADLGAVLGFTAGALGKIAVDVLTLSRTEIGEVAEPGPPGRGASSAMPHKRNPVLAAMIRGVSLHVPVLAAGLTQSLTADDERSGGTWQAEWAMLRECLRLTGGATHTLSELAAGLEAKPERMAANLRLTSSGMASERLVAVLTPRLGRATAQELLTTCTREAALTGRPLSAVLSAGLAALPSPGGAMPPAEVEALCAPDAYLGAASLLVDRALSDEAGPAGESDR